MKTTSLQRKVSSSAAAMQVVVFTTPAVLKNPLLLFCIPAASEVLAYCTILGLDPETESDLMYIAKEGIKAPVPPQWKPM